jgi:hypothetical protein
VVGFGRSLCKPIYPWAETCLTAITGRCRASLAYNQPGLMWAYGPHPSSIVGGIPSVRPPFFGDILSTISPTWWGRSTRLPPSERHDTRDMSCTVHDRYGKWLQIVGDSLEALDYGGLRQVQGSFASWRHQL